MPRKSPIHYIYPSAISVTPNANDSENDLAVTVIGGAKIKVYSPKSGISMSGGVYQEWSFTGRNRRLSQSGSPYTIYARLAKSDKSKGYLVFAPKDERDGKWYDKYCYVTPDGIFPQLSASHPEGCRVVDNANWWIRLGDVSLPEGGKRTVSFDTGILGTEEFNTEWAVSPDSMPMRIEIGCVIDDEDAGPTPYVYWDKMLNLTATLVEGWTGTDIERFDHWEISRNTGDADADAAWPSAERASLFAHTGRMTLSHERGALDDFNSAVATTFTVTAWGRPDDSQDPDAALVPMKEASIVILAETVEKYEVVLSSSVVSYNPSSDTYRPEDGIVVNVRATDQRSNVYRLGCGQINAARIVARYAHVDTDVWSRLQFTDSPEGVAEAVIPVAAFAAQKNVNVRLENADGKELDSRVVSFLRDGEDSREREWIFFRSKDPVVFGDASSEHPLPSLISGGEVEPDGAASGEDTNKNQDGWVPQGWWDEQHGTDDEYRYEYSSYRDYIRSGDSEGEGGHWGDFTKPNTWSYYGEDAVSYRCKWLLDGVEVWQLVSSYTGAFRGTLPLVATLMKRKGSGSEEPVTAIDTVITVIFEGLDASYTEAASSPQFTINEVDHPEMVSYLNDARLTAILIVFETREETFSYSIPVIKEADEDSIIQTMEEHGSELFLSKTSDDTANGFITFAKGFLSLVDVVIRGAITAAEGIMNTVRSSNYTGDGIADTGFRLTSDDGTGSSALTVDNLHVRKKATFEELEVKKETAIAGNQVYSSAANIIVKTDFINESGEVVGYVNRQVPWLLKKMPFLLKGVFFGRIRKTKRTITSEELKDIKAFRLYFLAEDDDREIDNMWAVGDLARCQTINLKSSKRNTYVEGSSKPGNVYWWRKVIRVSSNDPDIEPSENPDTTNCQRALIDGKVYHWFDVSNVDGGYDEGSDIPAAGDHVVQFGNDSNTDRMNIEVQEINGADASALKFYDGIHSFDIDHCFTGGSTLKNRISAKAGVKFTSSKFELITEYAVAPVPVERGAWVSGTVYYYYDLVQHNGATWLCVASTGNRYQALEDISPSIPAKTELTQAQYNTLTVEQKIKCTRIATGSTTTEPTEQNVEFWRPYAQKGDQGQSSFTSHVFKRQNSQPGTPTGGSYSSPVPSGWSDGVPDGTAMVWMSTRIFSSDGKAPQQSGWTTPRQMTDTADFDVEFSSVASPNPPSGHPNTNTQWGNTSSSSTIWMATSECHNGVWSAWQIAKIKGEKGSDGPYYVDDYGISAYRTSYSDISSWSSSQPEPTAQKPYVWKRSRLYNPNTQTYGNATYVCLTGEKGVNGKDGWMITANPANVIITQSLNNNTSSFSSATVSFVAKKGSANATIASIGTPTSSQFFVSKSGNTVVVSGPQTHGTPAEYYTEGSFKVNINVTDPDTGSTVTFSDFTVLCYANLLGSWKEEVVGDTKTEVAKKIEYAINGTTGQVDGYEALGEFKRSSEENTSILTKKVDNGKNLLSGVLTAAGWKSGIHPTYNNDAKVDENDWIKTLSGHYNLKSPVFTLSEGTYTLSLEANSSVPCIVCKSSDNSVLHELTLSGSGRKKATFSLSSSESVYIAFSAYSLRYPQLEIGSTATDFDADTIETSSRIRQTADEIELKVGETGIDIDHKEINLTAGKVNFKTSTGGTNTNISIDPETGTLHAVNGEFEGTITSTKGSIGGFKIADNCIGEVNPYGDYNYTIIYNDGRAVFSNTNSDYNALTVLGNTKINGNTEITGDSIALGGGKVTISASSTQKVCFQGQLNISSTFSNYKAGDVYKDDFGSLFVRGFDETPNTKQIEVKTSSFDLPKNPPIGTMFFVKRVLNDITIKTSDAYVLNGSNNGTLWERNSTNIWSDTHSMVLFYLGNVGGNKYWTMIYSN